MTGVGSFAVAVVMSLVAAWLITRLVIYRRGFPALPEKLLTALEIGPTLRGSRPGRLDVFVLGLILALLEWAAAIGTIDALRANDWLVAGAFLLHFAAVAGWYVYLSGRGGSAHP